MHLDPTLLAQRHTGRTARRPFDAAAAHLAPNLVQILHHFLLRNHGRPPRSEFRSAHYDWVWFNRVATITHPWPKHTSCRIDRYRGRSEKFRKRSLQTCWATKVLEPKPRWEQQLGIPPE